MATGKTTTLTFRIEPALKDALHAAAEQEHRSIANLVAVMIRDYCGREGIAIPEQSTLPVKGRKTAKNDKSKVCSTRRTNSPPTYSVTCWKRRVGSNWRKSSRRERAIYCL